MPKVLFTPSTKKFPFAAFASAKVGEPKSEAVMRSIGRTTGCRVVSGAARSWTEDSSGKRVSELLHITLTEKAQARKGGGYSVVGEFQVTVHF